MVNEGVKMKIKEKKRAFEEWLQCNSMEKYERYKREKCGNQAKGGGSEEDVKF